MRTCCNRATQFSYVVAARDGSPASAVPSYSMALSAMGERLKTMAIFYDCGKQQGTIIISHAVNKVEFFDPTPLFRDLILNTVCIL